MKPFDLEQAIARWRRDLLRSRTFLDDDLDELEAHLRDQVETLTKQGVDSEEAYRVALYRLGSREEVEPEYRKVRFVRSKRNRHLLGDFIWQTSMFRHYLKVARRTLIRHKGYALLNIVGLAMGVACCLVLAFYVRHELSYDRFHPRAEQTYRVQLEQRGEHRIMLSATLGERLERASAGVLQTARLFTHWEHPLIAHEETGFIEQNFYFADSTFFDVFGLTLLQGDPRRVLAAPHSVVLTESAARKYFGDRDPVGQTLRYNTRYAFTVTGVMADAPQNMHFRPDFIASLPSLPRVSYSRIMEDWSVFYTYVVLAEGQEAAAVERAATTLLKHETDAEPALEVRLQPVTEIHLHSHLAGELEANGDVRYVYLLTTVAVLILLIACINYINLTTARSMNRAQEVGVRKAIGAHRSQIACQIFGEAFLQASVAVLLAVALIPVLQPVLTRFSGQSVDLTIQVKEVVVGGLVLMLLIGFLAGGYPALLLSRFRAAETLKGALRSGRRGRFLRQSLVVVQFAVSVILIVGTLVVLRQLDYVRTANLGFDQDHVLAIPVQDSDVRERYESLRDEWLRQPSVRAVGATSSAYPGQRHSGGHFVVREEASGAEPVEVLRNWIDEEYLTTLKISVIEGRAFRLDASDASGVILNESAVRALGWETPQRAVGQTLTLNPGGESELRQVIGVVEDYHFNSLHHRVDPLVMTLNTWPTRLLVRIDPENAASTLATLETTWERFSAQPFTFWFLDEQIDQLYRAEVQWGRVLGMASLLAVVIACLGLVGLAAYTAARRTKEIGIRKVLGASAGQIVVLLSSDFLKLVLVAFVVASPVAYYAMHRWLETFAFRAELGYEVFVLCGALLLLIAFTTVSYQALRAALADPVDSLRYE